MYFEFFHGIYNFDEILTNTSMQSRPILTKNIRKIFSSETNLNRIKADDPTNQLTLLLLLLIEHKGKTLQN